MCCRLKSYNYAWNNYMYLTCNKYRILWFEVMSRQAPGFTRAIRNTSSSGSARWLFTCCEGILTVDCVICRMFPPSPTRQGVADDPKIATMYWSCEQGPCEIIHSWSACLGWLSWFRSGFVRISVLTARCCRKLSVEISTGIDI